jgi:hypothetical protein
MLLCVMGVVLHVDEVVETIGRRIVKVFRVEEQVRLLRGFIYRIRVPFGIARVRPLAMRNRGYSYATYVGFLRTRSTSTFDGRLTIDEPREDIPRWLPSRLAQDQSIKAK